MASRRIDLAYQLNDRYSRQEGQVYLTGIQALVRLPMMQIAQDRAAGLKTAGFISGYRGSPLGGYDQELWKQQKLLKAHDVVFKAGLNEDLAATAVWGSQQIDLIGRAKQQGVFGIWYGKGPGVDRTLDVFRHANAFGTSRHGGVLAIAGDDHGAQSSTLAHQTDLVFSAAMMPVLYPADIHELLDFGLAGLALSRFSGLWVGLKALSETVESSASINLDTVPKHFILPEDVAKPARGLNYDPTMRWPEDRRDLEEIVVNYRLAAARAFVRANGLDKITHGGPKRRFGIVTSGKAHLDFLRSLDLIGLSTDQLADLGVGVYKVGMSWPLEPENLRAFTRGLEGVLVIEEKRSLIEAQIHDLVFNWRADERPRVVGKRDENGGPLLPEAGEVSPDMIALAFGRRLDRLVQVSGLKERLDHLEREVAPIAPAALTRSPYFCSGCPHNSSTKVPEGSVAFGGIGCHIMALSMERSNMGFTHMGGEGAQWIGMEPFTEIDHVFQNLGDGTYQHSGTLAVRAAVQAGAHITYKILFNDAVAMTGGQKVDGPSADKPLTVPDIAAQMVAEGAARIAVVADDMRPYVSALPSGVSFSLRQELEQVQNDLKSWPGVSVLIYDQTCAAEKRRRRKHGAFPNPKRRVVINPRVCEGCGDCQVASNCLSVETEETDYGAKRVINQSSCNKDYSCLEGFCPSFVTVEGVDLAKPKPKGSAEDKSALLAQVPAPPETEFRDENYNILITGIGGTGVVTIGALIGMAAHLEGRAVSVLDFTGLAQKGGAVLSHVRIAEGGYEFGAARIAAHQCDLLLGCDLVVSAGKDALLTVQAGRTRAIINDHALQTGEFLRHRDLAFPKASLMKRLDDGLGGQALTFLDATKIAEQVFGDAIATNLFLLGFALQKGLVPVSVEAMERAIELNGVSVAGNLRTFRIGRMAAHDRVAFEHAFGLVEPAALAQDWRAILDRRAADLVEYQDAAYAACYRARIEAFAKAEADKVPGSERLAGLAARLLYKVMAYKDEYEVARLHLLNEADARLAQMFEPGGRIVHHLAPPLLSPRDPKTGKQRKRAFPAWAVRPLFHLLRGMKGVRGTALDLFGRQSDRQLERRLITLFESVMDQIAAGLAPANLETAAKLLEAFDQIRGYGHVKEKAAAKILPEIETLRAAFSNAMAKDQAAKAA